jgi:hypothetical protein
MNVIRNTPTTGLASDDHKVLKMWCVAAGRTLGSVREEALRRQLQGSPGIDLIKSIVGQVEQAIAQAVEEQEQPKKVNGKK